MHFPSLQASQTVDYHPTWSSASWKVRLRQQMMSRIFCVHGFDNLMMNPTQNPQRLMRTLLQVQGKHINNHRILRIEEYLNSFVRSTRKFWTGKELALMKEQEFPTIGGLMAMMILIFLMDLLILTDLLGLLIHLVCLRRFAFASRITEGLSNWFGVYNCFHCWRTSEDIQTRSGQGVHQPMANAPESGRLAIWSY